MLLYRSSPPCALPLLIHSICSRFQLLLLLSFLVYHPCTLVYLLKLRRYSIYYNMYGLYKTISMPKKSAICEFVLQDWTAPVYVYT